MTDGFSFLYRNSKPALAFAQMLLITTMVCAAEPATGPTTSQFIKEIGKEQYSEAEPPTVPTSFRWDFSKQRTWNYGYSQEVRVKTYDVSPINGTAHNDTQELSATGTLLIRSLGDGTAELVLKDMKTRMTMMANGAPKTMEQQTPPVVVQGVREDGSGAFGSNSQDTFLRLLFPIPNKSMAIGETVDVPAQFPFNALGSVLQVSGRSRIKLTRYVKIGERTCAQLDVDTDISDLKVPAELQGDYKCSAKGSSVLYFDVASRSFVNGTVALLMQFSIDAPLPQAGDRGQAGTAPPRRSKMSAASDTLIQVKLVD